MIEHADGPQLADASCRWLERAGGENMMGGHFAPTPRTAAILDALLLSRAPNNCRCICADWKQAGLSRQAARFHLVWSISWLAQRLCPQPWEARTRPDI